MRVLVVTAMYPTEEKPAFGSYVKTQIESLRRAGVDVELLVFDGQPRKWAYVKGLVQMHHMLAREKFDLVHAHYGYVGMVARTQLSVPLVVTYHGSDLMGTIGPNGKLEPLSRLTRGAGALLGRFADGVIVQSKQMASRIPGPHVHIAPHEIDLETFRPTPREAARNVLGLDREKKYLLFAADPRVAVKNFPLAEAVAEQLSTEDPTVELLVVYRETQPRLALYMSAADVLVFPSYQEGSPNIVKQAMACNLPIVATDVGDVREVIGQTRGCYLSGFDVNDFRERIQPILNRRERTSGRDAVSHLDCATVAAGLIDVYERTLQRSRRGRLENAAAQR